MGAVQYGLGIYGEPIYVWEIAARQPCREAESRVADPAFPDMAPAGRRVQSPPASTARNYRLASVPYRGGLLVAGESLTELAHVESVLVTSEVVAAPVLLVAMFLAALLIGLRSAKPIELAHRRQLEFTADASHELRTPLSVIEAELSLAQSFEGEPDASTIDRIARESERLKRIVDDLLWLARFDAAPPPPAAGAIDLGSVAKQMRGAILGPRRVQVARPRRGGDRHRAGDDRRPARVGRPAGRCAGRQRLQVRGHRRFCAYPGRTGGAARPPRRRGLRSRDCPVRNASFSSTASAAAPTRREGTASASR